MFGGQEPEWTCLEPEFSLFRSVWYGGVGLMRRRMFDATDHNELWLNKNGVGFDPYDTYKMSQTYIHQPKDISKCFEFLQVSKCLLNSVEQLLCYYMTCAQCIIIILVVRRHLGREGIPFRSFISRVALLRQNIASFWLTFNRQKQFLITHEPYT